MSIYRIGVDVGFVGAGPGAGVAGVDLEAGEAGAGLEAGAASRGEVLVVDGGDRFGAWGSGDEEMGSNLPLKGRMTSAMTPSETDSLGL